MERRHALAALLAAALGASALAGVAGAAVPTGGEALTKAAWIRKADRVCTSANRKLGPLIQEHFGDVGVNERPSDEAVQAYAEDFVRIARKEVAKIKKKLVPPAADEAQVEELLDAEEAAIDAVDEDPLLFLADDNPFEDVSTLAQAYGLKVCGTE